MEFLEYVARELMGPPVGGRMWRCPFHDDTNPSFSIRPPKQGHEVKFKCWGCDEWGDEFDLVKHFYPAEDYDERQERVHNMRLRYDVATAVAQLTPTGDRGEPRHERLAAAKSEMLAMLRERLPDWSDGDRELDTLRLFVFFAEIAYQHRVPLQALAGAAARHVRAAKAKHGQQSARIKRALRRVPKRRASR